MLHCLLISVGVEIGVERLTFLPVWGIPSPRNSRGERTIRGPFVGRHGGEENFIQEFPKAAVDVDILVVVLPTFGKPGAGGTDQCFTEEEERLGRIHQGEAALGGIPPVLLADMACFLQNRFASRRSGDELNGKAKEAPPAFASSSPLSPVKSRVPRLPGDISL